MAKQPTFQRTLDPLSDQVLLRGRAATADDRVSIRSPPPDLCPIPPRARSRIRVRNPRRVCRRASAVRTSRSRRPNFHPLATPLEDCLPQVVPILARVAAREELPSARGHHLVAPTQYPSEFWFHASTSASEALRSADTNASTNARTAAVATPAAWGFAAAAAAAELAAADVANIAALATSAATIATTDQSEAAPAALRAREINVRSGSCADTRANASARKMTPATCRYSRCWWGLNTLSFAMRAAKGITRNAPRTAIAIATSRL